MDMFKVTQRGWTCFSEHGMQSEGRPVVSWLPCCACQAGRAVPVCLSAGWSSPVAALSDPLPAPDDSAGPGSCQLSPPDSAWLCKHTLLVSVHNELMVINQM